MSFNEMMKKVRLEAGDSLRGLSDKTGINFSYIDKIERGTRPANFDVLEKLIETYPNKKDILLREYINEYIPNFLLEELKENSDIVTSAIKNLDTQSVFEMFFQRLSVEDRKELLKNIVDKLEFQSYKKGTIEEDREELEVIRKEIEKLKKQKEIISKEVSISEEELKKFDKATKEISILESPIKNAIKEIELVSNMPVPIEKTKIVEDFSDDISKNILDFQEEIIRQANEGWNKKKREMVTKLHLAKEDAESKKEAALKIKSELEHKVIENEALIKLSDQIKNEEIKLESVLKATQKCEIKRNEYDMKLDEVSNAINDYREIHNNYVDVVNGNTETNSDGLDFSVGIQFKNDAFCSFIRESINNNSLKKFQITFDDAFNVDKLTKDYLRDIIDKVVNEELKLLKNKTVENVLRDMLSDWYLVSYNVKLENDNINQMSPGKKALVLLKLLISMAESKCPILIDQPEDDLDNRSIFDELIPFIRKKKIERQIIIVTHNANVVLGGDAEEIIVANQEGKNSPNFKFQFEYRSGSIENANVVYEDDGTIRKGILNEKGIQQHICDILEGGEQAFDLRKHKYSI